MKRVFLLLVLPAFLLACKNEKTETVKEDGYEDLHPIAATFFQPISSLELEEPDPKKVTLGKYLFFDTRLSGEGNISCNSCHSLKTYGVDNERFSPGDAPGTVGGRNSPTVFHAALHKMQIGRAHV